MLNFNKDCIIILKTLSHLRISIRRYPRIRCRKDRYCRSEASCGYLRGRLSSELRIPSRFRRSPSRLWEDLGLIAKIRLTRAESVAPVVVLSGVTWTGSARDCPVVRRWTCQARGGRSSRTRQAGLGAGWGRRSYIISCLSSTCADRRSRIVLTCVAGAGVARKSAIVCRWTGETVIWWPRTRRACVRAGWKEH